jgi:hypothetical protein
VPSRQHRILGSLPICFGLAVDKLCRTSAREQTRRVAVTAAHENKPIAARAYNDEPSRVDGASLGVPGVTPQTNGSISQSKHRSAS